MRAALPQAGYSTAAYALDTRACSGPTVQPAARLCPDADLWPAAGEDPTAAVYGHWGAERVLVARLRDGTADNRWFTRVRLESGSALTAQASRWARECHMATIDCRDGAPICDVVRFADGWSAAERRRILAALS